MVFDFSISDPLARIQAMYKLASGPNYAHADTWGACITATAIPLAASLPTPTSCNATFLLPVTQALCNPMGTLHGGCAATAFDILTSCAIAPLARPDAFSTGGVTRTLNCAYLRPVPEGMTVVMECEVMNLGSRLCHVRATLREARRVGESWEACGPVLVTCEHGKVNTDPPLSKI